MTTEPKFSPRPLGIIAALPQEIEALLADMRAGTSNSLAGNGVHRDGGTDRGSQGDSFDGAPRVVTIGRREFTIGRLRGQPCVVTLARIGKVAAATTATALIHQFDVGAIVFTGVAGGVASQVRVGDVVVADTLMQHDLDASPLFPRFEVPLLGISRFNTDARLSDALARAAAAFARSDAARLAQRYPDLLSGAPRVHRGLVVSGDRFIAEQTAREALLAVAPDALAVEMEGAALAQVCYEYDVPCAVVRTISDTADAHAPASFATFLADLASAYSTVLLERFLDDPEIVF
jgi:adenosylhomocysteine nucleosidase